MFSLLPTKNIILPQSGLALFAIVVTSFYYNLSTGLSIGAGCLIALLPSLIFHKVFFGASKKLYPNQLIKRFYFAAMLKMLALIGLFVFFIKLATLQVKMLLLAFVIMQISCWFGYLFWLRKEP